MTDQPAAPPVFNVTAGSPTPEELAVVVALFTALANTEVEPATRRSRSWSAPARRMRSHLTPVPGGWRLSGLRM